MIFHAKENIILSCFFFFLRTGKSSFSFLKYHASFVKTKERSSFYQIPALKKIFFLIWTPFKRILFQKSITWYLPFFLIRTIFLCKVHLFVIIFFSFIELYVTFLDLLNLHYKQKCETELRNFFLSSFSMVTAWYMPIVVTSKIHWSRIWHLNFAQIKTKT